MQYEWPFRNHTNQQLLDELKATIRAERRSTAKVLQLLEEVDRRHLYAELGYPSLFKFCTGALRMSESEAFFRMTVARATRRFPALIHMIERGDLHLTGASKLAPHLTPENCDELLAAARRKTKREIEELIAARFPQPDVTQSIRRVPQPPSAELAMPKRPIEAMPPRSAPIVPTNPSPTPIAQSLPAPRPATVQPLAIDRYAIRFTANQHTRDLLDRARALLSHRSPNADVAEIVETALEALVENLEKQKFKTTTSPRTKTGPHESDDPRYIPAETKRRIYERDRGRCTFVAPDGQCCESSSFLEFDHIVPVAKGGDNTAENLRLRCRAHNALTAREEFGAQQMDLMSQGFRPTSVATSSAASSS